MTLKQTLPTRGSMSSRPTMSSQRWSRTFCSISTKPSLTWLTRRFMSCSPTGCLVRALSRRSTRSRTSMKTGKLNSVHITLTPCVINMLTFSCSYLSSWNKLTDRFFKTSPWPEAEAIASLVGNGESVIHYLFYFWFCMDSIIFILYCLSVILKKKR